MTSPQITQIFFENASRAMLDVRAANAEVDPSQQATAFDPEKIEFARRKIQGFIDNVVSITSNPRCQLELLAIPLPSNGMRRRKSLGQDEITTVKRGFIKSIAEVINSQSTNLGLSLAQIEAAKNHGLIPIPRRGDEFGLAITKIMPQVLGGQDCPDNWCLTKLWVNKRMNEVINKQLDHKHRLRADIIESGQVVVLVPRKLPNGDYYRVPVVPGLAK